MQVARAFFQASTKLSDDNEDFLPQVRGVCATCSLHMLLSCLHVLVVRPRSGRSFTCLGGAGGWGGPEAIRLPSLLRALSGVCE